MQGYASQSIRHKAVNWLLVVEEIGARWGHDPSLQTLRPSAAATRIAGPKGASLTADLSLTHCCDAGLTPGSVSLTPAGPRRHPVPRTNRSNDPADYIGSRSSAANLTSPAGI
jgi:hypothetical protein